MLQVRTLFATGLAGILATLTACGDDDGMVVPDAGPGETDSGPIMIDAGRDAGPPVVGACDAVREVTGEMGVTTLTGDTSMIDTRARDLGPECGNPDAARFAPQEIIAYTVPGTGMTGIRFSTDHAGTEAEFAVVVQVRETCETIPSGPRTCFNPADGALHPSGAFMAEGGSTVYFVVTGYSEPPTGILEEGTWELTIETVDNAAPTITAAQAALLAESFELHVAGMDDGSASGYSGTFLDASGAGVDFNEDGTPDVVGGAFLNDVSGMTSFVGYDRYPSVRELFTEAGVTQMEVRVVDDFGLESDPLTVTVGEPLGVADACGDTAFCAIELTCDTAACAPATAATTACAAATAVTITPPTTATTSTTVTGTVPDGVGLMEASCTTPPGAPGPETLYSVVVPAGAYDLIARTDLSGTGETDTVLSLRTACGDPTTEIACNDDIDTAGMVYTSRIEALDVPAGTHTIVVEQWGEPGAAGPFQMEVSLRPVLATGEACDNAGVMNRCAAGACASSVCP